MFVRTAFLAATAAALSVGAPALAGPAHESVATQVEFGDLDLTSASGERRLKSRVRMAATRVCGNPGSHGLQAMRRFEDCRSAAIAAANQDVTRVVAAARNGGPALAGGGSSITVSSAAAEK